jgi:NAD(P)H-hydrate repair Nnr-like enzyme with NAD(P)H-hydrate dehydratase domain
MVNLTSPEAVVSDGAPADEHVQAWIAGPGAVDEAQQQRCEQALAEALQLRIPAVLDAGALEIAGRSLADTRLRPWIVLTPHAGELAELLRWCEAWDRLPEGVAAAEREQIEADPVRWAQVGAQATGATVLLKGATTTIAAPVGAEAEAPVLTVGGASPWLATAGSGDTLAGMLGTLLAHDAAQPQHLEDRLPAWLRESAVPEQALEPLAEALRRDARWALLAGLATVLQARASHVGGEGPQPCRPEDIRAALTRVGG